MKILLAGIAATSLMTLFSYLVSRVTGRQFREPQLLNILIKRSKLISFAPGKSHLAGWLIHYTIGFIFVFIFALLWKNTALEPTVFTGALLGFLFGFIGITGWKIMFYLNPDPPEIAFKEFYFQLIIAHVIFGIGAVLPYLL